MGEENFLCSNIKYLRMKKGIKQNEFAKELNVSPQAVSKWETGKSLPDPLLFSKIAKIFNITIDELIGIDMSVSENSNDTKDENCDNNVINVQPLVVIDSQEIEIKTIGFCKTCGITVTNDNLGTITPVVKCASCLVKEEEEKIKKKNIIIYKIEKECKTQKTKILCSHIFSILPFILFLIISFGTTITLNKFMNSLIFGYAFYAFISCLIFDTYIREIMEWALDFTFKAPGVIFSLDLDGLIFLIAVKVIFAIIGFIIAMVIFLFGVTLSCVLSAVSYPIIIIKEYINLRNMRNDLKIKGEQ